MKWFRKPFSDTMRLRTRAKRRSNQYSERFANSRLSEIRRERRQSLLRSIATMLLALGSAAAIAWIMYLLFFSKTLRVQRIIVEIPQREHTVTEEQVEDTLVFTLGTHLTFLDTEDASLRVREALPRLSEVQVKKIQPGTLQVIAYEYPRMGTIRQPLTGLSYTVNEGGRILARAAEPRDGDLQIIALTTDPYAIDQVVIAPAHLRYLRGFLSDIKAQLDYEVDHVTYDPLAQEVKVKVLKGAELWVDFTKPEKETILDLVHSVRSPQLKDKRVLYIDLRLPNGRVDYRLG